MSFRPCQLLTFIATLALALPAFGQQDHVRLPSLGSSFETILSPADARAYGSEFLHQLRAAHLVLDDPQVDQYLDTVGYRLVAASPDPAKHITFTLLNIPEINSFATFGGYIFIFSGIFTMTQNQNELAAVMAHELSHEDLNHLRQKMEDDKKSLPLYLAGALLAGLAASAVDSGTRQPATLGQCYGTYEGTPLCDGQSYSSPGSDAAFGAFESVMAMMQQHQINYSRGVEEQADALGINTMAKAGFDPIGMADVFARMQDMMRPGGSGGMAAGNMPTFLENHPTTGSRIALARARAHVLEQQMHTIKACVSVQIDVSHCREHQLRAQDSKTTDPSAPGLLPLPFVKHDGRLLDDSTRGPSELQYELMRERVRVLSASDPNRILAYYTRNMARNPKFAEATANRYGYGLALVRLGKASKALPVMAKLVREKPDSLTLALGLADAERHAGQNTQALKRYASLNATWPDDPAVVLPYSRTLLDSRTKANAKTAQGLLKPLLNDDSEPSLYQTYGHASLVAGDPVGGGIAYANASFLSGHAASALGQLHRLLKRKDLTYYTRARIDADIAQITPIVLEMRRRHIGQDHQDDFNSLQDSSGEGPAGLPGLHFGACAGAACLPP